MISVNPKWFKALANSPLMDTKWYSQKYGIHENVAIFHYLLIGYRLLCDPSMDFSTEYYVEMYPDIFNAGIPALAHYEIWGKNEGRKIKTVSEQLICKDSLWQGFTKTGLSKAVYCPESSYHSRKTINSLVEEALAFDCVSFDIFDTLVLRDIYNPTDLFRIIEADTGIVRFAQLRVEAEATCYRTIGTDANIDDIYKQLSTSIKLDIQSGIKREFEYELKICRANPYMKQVFDKIKAAGKQIILVSDMYWPAVYLESLLRDLGYDGWTHMFVSCDCGVNKSTGLLQEYAWDKIGREKTVFHIGDNQQSDIEGSKFIGWSSEYYKSCRDKSIVDFGNTVTSIPGSIRAGILCNELNNGASLFSKEYEHGYIYGGMLIVGFCEWIDRFVKTHNDDLIWFLARDMDIISKAYLENYNTVPSRYVSISRSAMLQLNIQSNPAEFYSYYYKNYMYNGHLTIKQVLKETQLTVLNEFLFEEGLKEDDLFSEMNYDNLYRIYENHLEEVCESFSNAVTGAVCYFTEMLDEHRNICIVDLGWNGTIMIELKRFFEKRMPSVDKLDFVLFGASGSQTATDLLTAGVIHSYAFSSLHDTALRINDATLEGNLQIMCLEALFSADQPTLLSFGGKAGDKDYTLIYGEKTEDSQQIQDIQRGMLDFVKQYRAITRKLKRKLEISPEDAFRPYLSISNDYEYLYLIFKQVKEYEDGSAVSGDKKRLTTLGNIMKKRNLV